MSILQFVWQLTILFGIGILVLIGLFSSPWYILAAALLIVLVLIQRWMPDPNLQLDLLSDIPGTDPEESGTEPTPTHPEMLYRGATYTAPTAPIPVPDSEKPAPKQYRGAVYSQPPSPPCPTPPAPAVLRYRGVPYNAETTPDPEPTPTPQSVAPNSMKH